MNSHTKDCLVKFAEATKEVVVFGRRPDTMNKLTKAADELIAALDHDKTIKEHDEHQNKA